MDVYKVCDSLLYQKHDKYKFPAHIADYSSSLLTVFMGKQVNIICWYKHIKMILKSIL